MRFGFYGLVLISLLSLLLVRPAAAQAPPLYNPANGHVPGGSRAGWDPLGGGAGLRGSARLRRLSRTPGHDYLSR